MKYLPFFSILLACSENSVSKQQENNPPSVELLAPTSGETYTTDQLVHFFAKISDEEDDTEDLLISWHSNIDGSLELVQPINGAISDNLYLSEGEQLVTLRAEDSSGKISTQAVSFQVLGASTDEIDLRPLNLVLENTAGHAGDVFGLTYDLEKTGNAPSGSFEVSVVFAENYAATVEACSVSLLDVSSSPQWISGCTIPDLPDGYYSVGLILDVDNSVEETDETNNSIFGEIEFHITSDFGVDGFDYPVGTPISMGGSGSVTEAHDGDGYYNALDWGESWSSYYYHCGEDWNGEGGGDSDYGDPVYATADGFVTAADSYGGGWGKIITIEHDIIGAGDTSYEVIESQYAHLSSIFVDEGDWVNRGDLIGEIGDANGIYSAHLHFEMRWDEDISAGGTNGYGCSDSSSGTFDPSEFIDSHRIWP